MILHGADVGGSAVDVGDIPASLRFRSAASAYFSRTFGTPTDGTKWTYSICLKRGVFGTNILFGPASGSAVYFTGDVLYFTAGGTNYFVTSRVFRDPTSHCHLLIAVDTAVSGSGRIRPYLNGVEITAFSTDARSTYSGTQFSASGAQRIGTNDGSSNFFDGYLSRVCFVDGQALTPSSFGYLNTEINEWVSKTQSAVKAVVDAGGANSFMLDFDNATSLTTLGYDKSSKGNNWTLNNFSLTAGVTYDHMLDVPGNSFATLNPLDKDSSVSSISDGNLKVTGASANYHAERSSIPLPSTGKWSGAFTILGSSNAAAFGLCAASVDLAAWASTATANAWIVDNQVVIGRADLLLNGAARTAVTASGAAMTQNSVGKWAYDTATGKLWLGDSVYGWYPATLSGSVGDPAAGTNPTVTVSTSLELFVFSGGYGTTGALAADFGQQGYTPPTGFLALCQANLENTTVTVSGTFTGNASADGPFVWCNGVPKTLTINSNAVTFGTHADKTAGGFKLRTSSSSYNTAGSNTWTATIDSNLENCFKYRNAQGNP